MPKVSQRKKKSRGTPEDVGQNGNSQRNGVHAPKSATGSQTVYISIDPGANGGIAWITSDGPACVKMPATEKDILDTLTSLVDSVENRTAFAVLEKVHSMPGQGVASTFKFGASYGKLKMALVAAGISFEEVMPQKWQRKLGIKPCGKDESKTEFKNRLKAKAQEIFPTEKITLATADALLMAEYARRLQTGMIS